MFRGTIGEWSALKMVLGFGLPDARQGTDLEVFSSLALEQPDLTLKFFVLSRSTKLVRWAQLKICQMVEVGIGTRLVVRHLEKNVFVPKPECDCVLPECFAS